MHIVERRNSHHSHPSTHRYSGHSYDWPLVNNNHQMDLKKRKRGFRRDVDEEEEEDVRPKSKRGLVVLPSPPSPPGDSNDREVSRILGQEETSEASEASEANYSKHSSLLTDLSLTPSPRLSTPVNTDKLTQPQPPPEPEPEPEPEPDTQQPSNPSGSSEDPSSTCPRHQISQVDEAPDGTGAKASSINNNSRTVQDVILTCISENITSPSYCAPSPVYSIPSPGSAFSIVISKRRDSES